MGGLVFGKLAYVRNIIYIRMSPYEQKLFANFWANSWRGFKRDFNSVVPYAGPNFMGAYLLYCWGEAENVKSKRKNPKDYENDK